MTVYNTFYNLSFLSPTQVSYNKFHIWLVNRKISSYKINYCINDVFLLIKLYNL